MRRLISTGLCALLFTMPSCKLRRTAQVETVEEEPDQILSVVAMSDPRSTLQLIKGFHNLEQGTWRWTKGQFSVTLRVPPEARKDGGVLEVQLTVAESLLQHIKPVTLTAKVNGVELEPQSFTASGQHFYRRPVPASAIDMEAVTIDFSLDNYLKEGQLESRELGIIVTSFGLKNK
jgi:hypothetical protein